MTNKLSDVQQKLMQMFLVGVPDTELTPATEKFLREYQPGGVIIFAHNYDTPALLAEYNERMQATLKEARNLPLFIGVDQEGGKVQRLSKPFTHFPEPAVIGAIDSPKLAFDIAEAMANELKAVGINLDFFPLCDIHTRHNNPVIGKRAFSDNEEVVSRISSAYVRGFVKSGVIPCVKHFPGHGDTTVDSHKVLPKVTQTWEELLDREIKPFMKAIRAKTDMFMMAHILNPNIDEIYPASISFSTITTKLRKELRYNKLVIADDMQMEAIQSNFPNDDVVALAINAGNDLLIYRDMERGREAMDVALRYLDEGRITPERVEESYERIQEVKKRMLKYFPDIRMEEISQVVGCEAHQTLLRDVMERAHNA